jgi:hypothetical protein
LLLLDDLLPRLEPRELRRLLCLKNKGCRAAAETL